jgi:hypothetical protein
MARGVQIKVQGLKEIKAKFGRIPDDVAQEVDAEMHAASIDFVDRAVDAAPKDRGILIQGISNDARGLMHHDVVSSSPISAYLEFGTRTMVQVPADLAAYAQQFKGPGGAGKGDAKKAIYEWCGRQGIDKKLWYLIYRKIMTEGINPHPFFFKQRAPVMAQLKRNLKPALTRALNK